MAERERRRSGATATGGRISRGGSFTASRGKGSNPFAGVSLLGALSGRDEALLRAKEATDAPPGGGQRRVSRLKSLHPTGSRAEDGGHEAPATQVRRERAPETWPIHFDLGAWPICDLSWCGMLS